MSNEPVPQDKTPVGVLQESCTRRGVLPVYEILAEGPVFEYRVVIGDLVGMGKGRRKKFAKQAAAKSLLSQVIDQNRQVQWYLPGGLPSGATQEEARQYLEKLLPPEDAPGENPEQSLHAENTIAILLDFCRKRRLPLPEFYEISAEEEGSFAYEARVGQLAEKATARTKKAAKRCSARDKTGIFSR